MATVKAVIAQKVEDSVLLIWGKSPTDYHAVGGTVSSRGRTLGGHVAVMSSLTGSVMEATLPEPPNYFTASSPGNAVFQDVVSGRTAFVSAQREANGKPAYVLGGNVADPRFAPSIGGDRASGYQKFLDSLQQQPEKNTAPQYGYRKHMPAKMSGKKGVSGVQQSGVQHKQHQPFSRHPVSTL
jgi:hypothetical protein